VYRGGIYYTSADSLRIKLNWQPGINGLPLTPKKKNRFHELTFGIHDKGHACFRPDLFVVEDTKLDYYLYMINRMMSEAITLFFADCLFVTAVKDEYDTVNDRGIFPLFADMDLCLEPEHLLHSMYKIMEANVFYFVLADESCLQALLPGGKRTQSLHRYLEKFTEFAKGEYIWSKQKL